MYEAISFEKSGGVVTISLNRPKVLNVFNGTLHAEIHEALNAAAEDEGARCIVLRGEGRGFSAGADLADITRRGGVLREARARLHRKLKGAPKERVVDRERTTYDSLDSEQETFQRAREAPAYPR